MGIVRTVQDPKTGKIIAQEWCSENGKANRWVDRPASNEITPQNSPAEQARRSRSRRV